MYTAIHLYIVRFAVRPTDHTTATTTVERGCERRGGKKYENNHNIYTAGAERH